MLDMFFNYENNIDKKEYPEPLCYDIPKNILESNTNTSIVYDIAGNQIGVQAKYLSDFDLYFNLCGHVENSSITELVANSTINFQILNFYHQVIISKSYTAASCYDADTESINIHINKDEAAKLKQDSYRVTLDLAWPGGGYNLFAEKDAKLIIR